MLKFNILFSFFFWINFLIYLSLIGCFFYHRNYLTIFLFLELNISCLILLFIFMSLYLNEINGMIFSYCIFGVAACDTVIGLSLVLNFFRLEKNLNFEKFKIFQKK